MKFKPGDQVITCISPDIPAYKYNNLVGKVVDCISGDIQYPYTVKLYDLTKDHYTWLDDNSTRLFKESELIAIHPESVDILRL